MTVTLRDYRQSQVDNGVELIVDDSASWWYAALTIRDQVEAASAQ